MVRKVDELPVPGVLELVRKQKAAQCFTVDTQALVDMSMFAKAIGKGLLDPADSAPNGRIPASQTSCSCGAVCWPNCPFNIVHGDPTDFLRARRVAKMTWAVARIQARWRGKTTRRKLRATAQLPIPRDSQAPLNTDGGLNAAKLERNDALADLQVRGDLDHRQPCVCNTCFLSCFRCAVFTLTAFCSLILE